MAQGCASLFYTPKQEIRLLIEPRTIDYKCFQTNTNTITCTRNN